MNTRPPGLSRALFSAVALTTSLLVAGFGAPAALAAPAPAAPAPVVRADDPQPAASPVRITLQRADNAGDTVPVGTHLMWEVTYDNPTDKDYSVSPTESNLTGVKTDAKPNCRFSSLKAHSRNHCYTATYVAKDSDVAAGFTPSISWDVTRDGEKITTTTTAPKVTVRALNKDETLPPLAVALMRKDTLGAPVTLDDTVKYKLVLVNQTNKQIKGVPTASTLENTAVSGNTGYCRFGTIQPNATVSCDSGSMAFHKITGSDIKAGSFTPTVTYQAPTDGAKDFTVTGPAVPVVAPLTVALERVDTLGDTVSLGDTLRYKLVLTNHTGKTIAGIPSESNLENTVPTNKDGYCRYRAIEAHKTVTCEKAEWVVHTVTADDVKAGTYTPHVKYEAPFEGAEAFTVTGTQVSIKQNPLTVTIERADDLGEPVYVGDRLAFTVTYTNNTSTNYTVYPRTSTMEGATVDGKHGGCRWDPLKAGQSAECKNIAYHTVTTADAAKGTYTPSITFDLTADRDGKQVKFSGVETSLAPIPVKNEVRPDEASQPREQEPGTGRVLATPGKNGFDCYRIPALTTAKNGWILAAWDGRQANCADAPEPNSIVQRISTDGGKSWQAPKVVAAGHPGTDKYGYSDPSYVVDRTTGEIFLFFVKSYDRKFQNSDAGVDPTDRNVLHAAVISSTDNGLTWSEPRIITDSITTDKTGWKSRFAASGEGIQLKYGDHAGRLVQQYTLRVGDGTYEAVSVYSDDHGKTWKVGKPFGTGMDENKVVELSDGTLMVNSRASDGTKARKIALSTDGGETYGDVTVDNTLVDPHNNGSIIRAFPNAPKGSAAAKVLLFSNTNNSGARRNGTIRVSFDDGKTWPVSKVFEPGAVQYSTLTALPTAGTYGLLYEAPDKHISYMPITLDWLGVSSAVPTGDSRTVYRGGNLVKLHVTNLTDQAIPAGATLSLGGPDGWTWDKQQITLPEIPANGTIDLLAKVQVPAGTDPGARTIPMTLRIGDKTTEASFTLTVALKDGEKASTCATGVTVANEKDIPAEAAHGNEVSKMLDGKLDTIWHSLWNGTVTLPLDIDFVVPKSPNLAYATFTPRSDNSNNGKITKAELYLVEGDKATRIDKDGIAPDGTMTFALTKDQLAGEGTVTLRLRILSTIGDQNDKFASIAEVCFHNVDTTPPTHDEVVASIINDNATTNPGIPWTPLTPAQPVQPKPDDGIPWTPLTPAQPVQPKPDDGIPWTPLTPAQPVQPKPGDDTEKPQPNPGAEAAPSTQAPAKQAQQPSKAQAVKARLAQTGGPVVPIVTAALLAELAGCMLVLVALRRRQ
ncbi:MAG: exo-alpha-sialidase [Actinomycetaceae bacterium]|nr:exo-alpha-sialidase [Actinomycetaceae bacterium]